MSVFQLKRFGMELLGCPFCGVKYRGTTIVWKGPESRIECFSCGALGPFPPRAEQASIYIKYISDEDAHKRDIAAIKAWNRREIK